jgi:hypothetical protein
MKAVLVLLLAIVLGWFVLHLVEVLFVIAVHMVLKLAFIALFCAVVYWIFKALTAEKQRI